MREIIFRGKRSDTGEWIYGDLLHNVDAVKIREQEQGIQRVAKSFVVILETVGQYTGMKDKNGVMIFENDIVIIGGNKSFPTMIEFLSGSWQCVRKYTDKGRENEYSYLHRLEYDNPNQYEVIGNRFDNPELLKGK